MCFSSSDLFGCIGLRHKKFCILNKVYSESEFKKLREKIINQMNEIPYKDAKGRIYKYGEFFPIEMSPFAYNNTVTQEHFPLSSKIIKEEGYAWYENEERNYKPTVSFVDLPQSIGEVFDTITNEIISCEAYEEDADEAQKHNCTIAFKIIKPELDFYRKMNLPLPTKCPNSRHYDRIKQRNPLKLWQRNCECAGAESDDKNYKNFTSHIHSQNHCPNKFETAYSPDRKEIVYCESCYNNEVS